MTAAIEARHGPNITKFVIVSMIIHAVVVTTDALLLKNVVPPAKKPPIKVKYIEPEKKKVEEKKSTLIDAPMPRKIEKPTSSELLAAHDSRAHSNTNKKKSIEYRRNKTVVPKIPGRTRSPFKRKETPRVEKRPPTKTAPEPVKEVKNYPLSKKGFFIKEPKAEKEVEVAEKKQKRAGSALAFLDGFDAKKFAKMNTNPGEEADDDEPISLNTTETKYASYFARIKHQIERVWIYPEEAARRGISGEMTLRFQISKDGNLVEVYLVDASGSSLLDLAAVKAVKGAAPFYPFPLTITKEKLSILATFIYSPTYGAYRRR